MTLQKGAPCSGNGGLEQVAMNLQHLLVMHQA
jgi:hypothetical protein